ncbi:MAG: nucleotide sugar dehydrogenase [archaeon]
MNVCVFGLWHLGCVTAACLADSGCTVIGLDFDEKTITNLKNGKPPLFEPGLEELIKKNLNSTLSFTTDAKSALAGVDVFWVAFDTPVDDHDVADLAFVKDNIRKVLPYVPQGAKVIISSQAPVGFTKEIEDLFVQAGKSVHVACSPENLRLGQAIQVFREPDRIIIGVRNLSDVEEFRPLFSKITDRLEWMKTESAEMTKHAINSFLATSVVFANELATICEAVGADAKEVARGLKTEARIGPKAYLGPGLSFAGGTLARDINFLIDLSHENHKKAMLIEAVKASNDYHKGWLKRKCIELFGKLQNVRFAVLGLTYKPNTNTLRRSSSVELCEWIRSQGGIVYAYDPYITALSASLSDTIQLQTTVQDALSSAECIIISTEHQAFKKLWADHPASFSGKKIIDPTGFIEKELPEKKDFTYVCVGRA